ncbi:HAD family phosphatase [Gemella sp. GH3]|uniref:Cof-type HAD-IIB family hydrolase n=1 Tax=unclassified Gemella TaxID=2624949 RepID=UPI0015D062BB|nr:MULTISPECIES: Cof-type HAD-IIB family hydrolase [unclassified Gemella]MBF0713561.1 HAD family phosphatase [Gemella sp. GH3.1]NYS50513.1 HAD family phosphatase [Gemella sp. GH3]
MIKLVVTDIDDTLLNSKGELTEKTRNTIKKCIDRGIKVILASGRPDFGMQQYVKELNLDSYDNYLLSYNGAKMTNLMTGEVIYDRLLEVERIKFLINKAYEHNCDVLTYQDNKVLTNKANPYAAWEANALKTNLVLISDIENKIFEKSAKAIILSDPDKAIEIKDKLSFEIGDKYEVAMSKPFFIEVNDKNISKGGALEFLCERMGITNNELLAIGDGLNDLSMIEFAGCGVAMGNANQLLKDKANFISLSNDEEGFSYAIEKLVLNK